MVIRCANLVPVFFDTYRNILYQSDISGQDAQSASIPPHVFSCRLEASARGRWHPSTTSTSQNLKNTPDCIHSRSDATFLWRPSTTSTSQNLKNIPDCIHSRSDATFLWRPSTTSTHKISKTPPTASTPRPMPPSSGVPRPHPPNETSNVSPPASNAKSRRQKISRTDMRLRHSLSLAFRKKIKCIILIDKRIKTSASVYSKYHTKGGFYHGIQTFWKHDLSSS